MKTLNSGSTNVIQKYSEIEPPPLPPLFNLFLLLLSSYLHIVYLMRKIVLFSDKLFSSYVSSVSPVLHYMAKILLVL